MISIVRLIKKHDPTCVIYKKHIINITAQQRAESNRIEKDIRANTKHNKSGMALLLSKKTLRQREYKQR